MPTEQLTPWERWETAADGRTIVVHWTTNSAYRLQAVELEESAQAVRVTVREEVPDGHVTMMAAMRRRRSASRPRSPAARSIDRSR